MATRQRARVGTWEEQPFAARLPLPCASSIALQSPAASQPVQSSSPQLFPQPGYGMPAQTPASKVSATQGPVVVRQAAPYAASPNGFSVKAEPVVSTSSSWTAAAPLSATAAVLEPPAPRSWTPSNLPSSNTPPRLSPAEALEREMAEMEFSNPNCSATACVTVNSMASGKPGTPPSTKQGYSSSAYHAGQAVAPRGKPGSPGGLMPAAQPFLAQHNNLMGVTGGGSGSSATGRASPGGMTKLKDLMSGHSLAGGSSATTVEAFKQPSDQRAVVATSSSASSFSAPGSSGNSVVAQRPAGKATRLLATGHASTASRTAAEWEADFNAACSRGDKSAALQLPGPSSSVVQCYVRRINGMLGMAPSFELRLESSDELLAVARRRKKSATSSYLISSGGSAGEVTRDDDELSGKMKANVLGTEFLLCGKGGNPSLHKGFNAQLLAVNFKPTINQVKAGPRTMTACVPVPEAMQAWDNSASNGQYDSLLSCMEAARTRELPMSLERNLVMLHTMKPHYDPVKDVHYLDFKGRVTKLSLKNFQLVQWDHNSNQLGNDLVMQFGKRGHDEYALDFCYPLSLLQAFALALSSVDSKLCYTM